MEIDQTIADSSVAHFLEGFVKPVEIRDSTGRLLGVFDPATVKPRNSSKKLPWTIEELERRDREETGRSLAEIMADLKAKQ